jgi:hypothetical protein
MTPAQPHPLRYRNKGTNEIFTDIGEMVLDAQKRYKILNNLVYCDIECVIQDPETPSEYFILDECGNWAYFPSKCYEVLDDNSHSASSDVLEQCETCYLKGTRACAYHGYPSDTIPKSCRYKVGVDAQFALDNLAGTFIIKNLRQQTKEREQE